MNQLYYGDNLAVLREYIAPESVDLVYLDPPFNSNQDYNVLFAEQDGRRAAAQIQAFTDTWRWDQEAAAAKEELIERGGRVADVMRAFWTFLGPSNLMAYLSMMAPRLVELRKAMRSTAALYLHCDPTASHYLKLLLDSIFGVDKYRSEIIWKRAASHGGAGSYHDIHDVILYYSKSNAVKWKDQRVPYDQTYIESHYNNTDEKGRRFQLVSAHGAGEGPARVFNGKTLSPPPGRHWMSQEHIDKLMSEGRIVFTKSGMPRCIRYLEDTDGMPLGTVWDDIFPVNARAAERLGYPTQKPTSLLARIINSHTEEGDIVLDPFCGCGTTIAAAQALNRQWIGIDITHLAINLIRHRLKDQFGDSAKFEVIGEPKDPDGAQQLATEDPYQFQIWALGLVGARPTEMKRGADHGIDGRLFFHDEAASGKSKQVILSVKAGKVQVPHVRDLRGVLDREKAEIGVLISFNAPTGPMRTEAATAGFYASPWGGKHPRIQLLTVEQLLGGAQIDMPPLHQVSRTFKKAAKHTATPGAKTGKLFEES